MLLVHILTIRAFNSCVLTTPARAKTPPLIYKAHESNDLFLARLRSMPLTRTEASCSEGAYPMRMVRRIALYIVLVLLAGFVSVVVAYGAYSVGVSTTTAQWIGLGGG